MKKLLKYFLIIALLLNVFSISALADETRPIEHRRASYNLYIKRYYQEDYSDLMQTCGTSIYSQGCTLTSVTMVANYLNFTDYDPSEVNRMLGNGACPLNWATAEEELNIRLLYNKDDYYINSGNIDDYEDFIVNHLCNDRPLIFGMRLGDGTSHYVVVNGYNTSTGVISIVDPSRARNKTTLQQYLNSGAIVKQIVVYS